MRRPLWPLTLTLLLNLGCTDGDPATPPPDETGTAEDSALPPRPTCEDAVSIVDVAGDPTGFELCSDGSVNRAEALATDTETTSACDPTSVSDPGLLYCTTDADCTESANGRCVWSSFGEDGSGCGCAYACATDADCADGKACVPDEIVDGVWPQSRCVTASCRTNADCDDGECGLYKWSKGNGNCGWTIGLACRSSEDTCRVKQECAGDDCAWDWEAGAWGCVNEVCEQED